MVSIMAYSLSASAANISRSIWLLAERTIRARFPRANLDDCGCWVEGILRGGALDVDKSWWIFAELDQLSGDIGAE